LWEKIPQGKLTVPLWDTTRNFSLWETQRAEVYMKFVEKEERKQKGG